MKDGTYYVSALFEYEREITPIPGVLTHIGLDYASNGLYVDSYGNCCDMPKFYREQQQRLAKAQKRLSRMEKGSNNYIKQKRKIAKISRKTANQRKDFLHKRSSAITNHYDLVSVENLNMKGMAQTLRLGKATMDNGYGIFLTMLAYKQKNKGHHFIKVAKNFPSSQLCHCGYKNKITKDLSIRQITCPACGHTYDRDHNAAINIDLEGLRLLTA